MKTFALFLLLACASSLKADAPTYGVLRVGSSGATIYEGASSKSKVAGKAYEGDEFVLRADKTFSGFYKIEYNGHICFIGSGLGKVVKQEEEPGEESPTAVPTRLPSKMPTKAPTAEPEGEVTEAPTPAPTRAAGKVATRLPTAEPGAEATEIPTAIPTRLPMKAPTRVPSTEPEPQATEIPTGVPTRVPERFSTPIPTAVPTRYVAPTAVPTRAQPTAAPTYTPQPQPTAVPDQPRRARGRATGRTIERRQTQQNTQVFGGVRQQLFQGSRGSGGSGGTTVHVPPRDPNKLSSLVFSLPLGMGKPYDVRPAFRPDLSTLESRNVNASGFAGLGLEARLWPILRIFGDWTAYNHWTRAADAGSAAPGVDLPTVASIISDTDIRYAMDTHGFRLGLKLGLPLGAHVEPWIGGGAGLYAWTAEYRDEARSVTYGDDHGLEFGWTGLGGIDFNFSTGGLLFRVTPFGEIGAPVVHPTITDIAGTGATWHDNQGTAVMVPRRLGLMLGIGY